MKVLIVDDEIKVCNLLKNLVDWKSLGLEIAGVVNDGQSAYELVQRLKPDIVITDIRMPGYNGIELIERVRQTDPDIHFIIISGYRQFEYASQAIKFGVEDYLLKPLKQAEMERILRRIAKRHEETLSTSREKEDILRRMNQSVSRLREHFVKLLINAEDFAAANLTLASANEAYHLRLRDEGYQILLVQAVIRQEQPDSGASELLERKVKGILEAQIEPAFEETVFGAADGYVVCLMNGAPERFEAFRGQMKRISGMIASLKDIFETLDVSLALSGVATSFAELAHCGWEARAAMLQRIFSPPGMVLEYSDAFAPRADVAEWLDAHFRMDFKRRITLLDEKSVCEAVAVMHAQLQRREAPSGWLVAQVCDQLIELFADGMMDNGVMLPEAFARESRVKLRAARTLSETFATLEECFRCAIAQWRRTKAAEDTLPIRRAKQYIHEHYAEPVTLPSVSAEVGLNASYFSSLFKRETGVNFLDYLMEVRVDVAKELLVETEMSIGEIGEKVGYNDMKYFYKRFRQSTGVSLKEYRKLYH